MAHTRFLQFFGASLVQLFQTGVEGHKNAIAHMAFITAGNLIECHPAPVCANDIPLGKDRSDFFCRGRDIFRLFLGRRHILPAFGYGHVEPRKEQRDEE